MNEMTVTVGPMSGAVLQLIEACAPHVDAQLAGQFDAIRACLLEPIRVAVVGRTNSGKSTLVNALLRQRVAATDVSECTTVVTWFRYGHPERVELKLRDGTSQDLQLGPDRRLPSSLGVPIGRVESLQVWLSNDLLRSVTIIDTPGTSSAHDDVSATTRRLMVRDRDSLQASETAAAIAVVVNQNVRSDELDALRLFRSASASGVNAIAILSKADKITGEDDPMLTAREVACRQADRFRDEVSAVVPVAGLMAEAARAGGLTESDLPALLALASLPSDELDRMLWSIQRFVTTACSVSTQAREQLVESMDLYGVRCAVDGIRQGAQSVRELCDYLTDRSGVDEVENALVEGFRRKDDALKARWGLAQLTALTYLPALPGSAQALLQLRREVEALSLHPVMHAILEIEAVQRCLSGEVTLPEPLLVDLRRVVEGHEIPDRLGARAGDDLRALAADGSARWRSFAGGPATPKQAAVARIASRAYDLVWSSLAQTVSP